MLLPDFLKFQESEIPGIRTTGCKVVEDDDDDEIPGIACRDCSCFYFRQTKTTMKQAFFLDAPLELATLFILNQLQVKLVSPELSAEFVIDDVELEEHKNSSEIYVKCSDERVYVDIRDSADCWIRVYLESGDILSLPANLYHKFQPSAIQHCSFFYSSAPTIITKRFSEIIDVSEVVNYHKYRELVCDLCRQFFTAGWVTGTSGSISIRHGNRIYMTPSGVQKERIQPEDLYVLDTHGNVLSVPLRKAGFASPKLSDCAPLFLHAFQQRNAGF